jgi:hypothetical protein
MEIVNAIDSRAAPWFWAVNGAAGVLAAGIAVIVSIHSSIGTTLWCGAAFYLLLAPIAINLARLRRIEPDVVAVPAASGRKHDKLSAGRTRLAHHRRQPFDDATAAVSEVDWTELCDPRLQFFETSRMLLSDRHRRIGISAILGIR